MMTSSSRELRSRLDVAFKRRSIVRLPTTPECTRAPGIEPEATTRPNVHNDGVSASNASPHLDAWGIADGYHDVDGAWHPTPDATRERLRRAMGDPQTGRPIWFVEHGTSHRLWNANEVLLEDGTNLGALDELPDSLPIGYHDLVPVDGGPVTRLIVHPRTAPDVPRAWGVAVQVYALWSEQSWGIGDLRDLRRLAERVVALGGGAILTSPLHQPAPTLPQVPSPYFPSSRRAWNPLLLAIDAPVPVRLQCDPSTLIDRDDVWIAKRSVLEAEFESALDAGLVSDREPDAVAVWNARCDELHPDWSAWDTALPGLDEDDELAERARFHQWLQDRFAEQLADVAATGVHLIGDLAVGFSPDGADASEFRDLLALDVRVGAPPDAFTPDGQEWGIPPFVPWRLRASLYEPFIATVRASLRGVHGLRIDHVMGLFRQYWVPADSSPVDGAYVHFPAEELLAIVCLEATRAGAFVIGEDLGTVEPAVRDSLTAHHIAGTRVMWFEHELAPTTWPEASLATVTTHDLPTVSGVFERRDEQLIDTLEALVPGAATPAQAVHGAHEVLLSARSRLRLMAADDLAGATEQPNHPGDMTLPNWRLRLPKPVDELL